MVLFYAVRSMTNSAFNKMTDAWLLERVQFSVNIPFYRNQSQTNTREPYEIQQANTYS